MRYYDGMDPEVQKELAKHRKYLEAIYTSVEKTRNYFKWTLIVTIVIFVLPLIGLVFAIPNFLSMYSTLSTF